MNKVFSFVCGGLAGAAIALLFAPRTGEETRALIAEKTDEYWGKSQTWYDQGKSYVQETVSGVQPTLSKKGDELRVKIDNARVLIAEQVAKNASTARDVINEKAPAAASAISSVAEVVRGRIDTATDKIKTRSTVSDADSAQAALEFVDKAPAEAPNKVEPLPSADA